MRAISDAKAESDVAHNDFLRLSATFAKQSGSYSEPSIR